MKFKRKTIISSVIIIIAILLTIIIIIKNNKENTGIQTEEFVQTMKDGTRINNSNKLKETKLFDELEIKINEVKEKENITVLLGTITNNTNEEKGDYPINIQVIDKQGNEIVIIEGYIGKISPQDTIQLNCSATFDYANAYDINITKK